MHEHLRAWRKKKRLSLEIIAQRLGVARTSVGRWETGVTPISIADLQKLAALYNISTSQLTASPDQAQLVDKLDRAQRIMQAMDARSIEAWLHMGEAVVFAPKTSKPLLQSGTKKRA